MKSFSLFVTEVANGYELVSLGSVDAKTQAAAETVALERYAAIMTLIGEPIPARLIVEAYPKRPELAS